MGHITLHAVPEDEIGDLLFRAFGKAVAPHQRIARDERRAPDFADLRGLFRVGDFEAADGFVVASRHIHLPVGDGERVGLMVGGNHVLENFLRVDVVLGEHVVAGHEEPGGRVGIAVAETKPSRVLEHVVHALERTLLVHHKQGVVAVRTVRRRGLGENGTVGTVHHLDGALVADPAEIDLFEAHPLNDPGVVRSEERLDLEAGGLFHVGEEGVPQLFEVLGGFRGDDAEVQDFRSVGTNGTAKDDGRRRNGDQET